MRIDVVGRNIEVTQAIREFAESKVQKVIKFNDMIKAIVVTVVKDDHHAHGTFGVELRVDVEHHESFVSNAHANDLYAAIDDAVHKGVRQLHEDKERRKPGPHRG